jgi:hypothetical protein
VQNITYLYPLGEDGYTLDRSALEGLIKATQDKDEEIRDWACFILHNNVDNLNNEAEQTFERVVEQENQNSDTYMEAVVGLTKMGHNMDEIICENLARDDCGRGWLSAVELSGSAQCFESLVDLYNRILTKDSNDFRLEFIEELFTEWNGWEPVGS